MKDNGWKSTARPSAYLVRNAEKTLYEIAARDEWQSTLMTQDGMEWGVVIRKIVEPTKYLIRYLVVFNEEADRHILLPATTVIGIDLGEVYCDLTYDAIARLPAYAFSPITKQLEIDIHAAVHCQPYWLDDLPSSE